MDEKTLGILNYITPVGWLIVFFQRKKRTKYIRFHLRQMYGIILATLLSILLFIFTRHWVFFTVLFYLVIFVLMVSWIIGIMGAINEEKRGIPFIGDKFQKWFEGL